MAAVDGGAHIDGEAAFEAVRDRVEGDVFTCVRYDAESFDVVHVAEATENLYEDREAMYAHFEEIHSYLHLDVNEMELFTEQLFPVANDVCYIATGLDAFTLVRVYAGEEGLFLSVEPDEPVEPLVAAVRETVEART